MQYMGLNEIREKYLSFFESKEHLRMPSFSLVPKNDNSLLLINSGMAPMKKYFTGELTPPRKRVTTCQKCIRTPDIERVGKTARHGTFFEMLGNFSFGDYFKNEATAWAWEFVTKVMELPVDRIWVSIYEDDDEAFEIWTKKVGVSPDRIVRLGKEDNFWEHGEGPCGPCSELYFDRGEEKGCGSPDCKVGCDCDRFVEFWNLVFTQFDSDGKGNYSRLANPNIDTGMGLERLACIMQGVDNLFEVDTVANIMKHISKITGAEYHQNDKTDVSLRVITDHIRSTVMMIGDGVLPSNTGRGYVLRRLLRRAARHGRLLGVNKPFLFEVCDTVINENKGVFPELLKNADYIKKVILSEEEKFSATIDNGMELLSEIITKLMVAGKNTISGEDTFKLYDTYGFPIDLIIEIAAEKKILVDEQGFKDCMQKQRDTARESRQSSMGAAWSDGELSELTALNSTFSGYEKLSDNGKIIAIAKNSDICETLSEGEEGIIVLDNTPFYAESGGQVADIGQIKTDSGIFEVTAVKKASGGAFLHSGTVKSGVLEQNQTATAEVCAKTRKATARNHTAAHLLQAALRQIVGDHVHQAGQLVDSKRLRFDFTHFSPVSQDEIKAIEALINEKIFEASDVITKVMDIDEAKNEGAMALFGEKYSDKVRVVSVDDFSKELCGGTHVSNTAQLGMFKIISESSTASGVRRIEAVTGEGVFELLNNRTQTIFNVCQTLKIQNPDELESKAVSFVSELKEKANEIDELQTKIANIRIEGIFENAKEINGFKFISASMTGTKVDVLRNMGDIIKDKTPDVVAALSSSVDGKATLLIICGADAVKKGAHAGKIIKEIAPIFEGNGGGRPDSATAGVKNILKLDEAIIKIPEILQTL
ncbi:MAG: alanine--tRNA ligase [Ruminococcaceae bacterium]|nr:alanine--tRNA ligase [Oscillospiraceae bacterium]